jgi:hypothetical protein
MGKYEEIVASPMLFNPKKIILRMFYFAGKAILNHLLDVAK